MPAPSLRQLATATAIKHHRLLHDVGNLPYALVRPILLKVDNPQKLHSMEVLSPQLAEEDQELWLEFIKRDIPQWQRYSLPKKTNQWYQIYCDLRAEVQRSLDADAEKLKSAIDGIQSERARLTPKIITGPRGKGVPGMRSAVRQRYSSSLPRSELSSASKKKSIFAPQRRNNALAVPTKHLSTRASQVKQAPRALVEEHRRPAEQLESRRSDQRIRAPGAPALGNQRSPSRGVANGSSAQLAEREARLRALTCGDPPPSSSGPSEARSAASPRPTKTSLKRRASSPPPSSFSLPHSSLPSASSSSTAGSVPLPSNPAVASPPARPAVVRKKPDDPFIRPKKRRVV